MDDDKKSARVTSGSKMTVADIFPISSEKVKNFMTQERQRTPVKCIFVAPKSLVVSVIEENTSLCLEKVFEQRTKEVKDESRGNAHGKAN